MAVKNVAVVICSTRPGRVSPFVAGHVLSTLKALPHDPSTPVELSLLDLADQKLPLFDEPVIPGQLPEDDPTPHYVYEHSRAWSAAVRKYDAFIWVTPQYNWSIPAGLKNALDYLFYEWHGKPSGIVTYGFRGGVKAAPHLREVLSGVRAGPVTEQPVGLKLLKGTPEEAQPAMKALWDGENETENIKTMYGQLLTLLFEEKKA